MKDDMSQVPLLPVRLDWSSAIGLFILNFGSLDVALVDVLKGRLPPACWKAMMKGAFHDRVVRLRSVVDEQAEMVAQKAQWVSLIERLEGLRALRNHLAHGAPLLRMAEDGATMVLVFSLARDISEYEVEAREVTFDELWEQTSLLADLIGELRAMGGEPSVNTMCAETGSET